MKSALKTYFSKKRFTRFNRDVFGLIMLFVGAGVGSYIATNQLLIPTIFAATSPWTQTDWSGGTASGTVTDTVTTYESVTNIDTGTSGEFDLDLVSGWSGSHTDWKYRKTITFDNTTSNLGVTSEALSDFPVLVKLDDGVDIDYSKTQDAGEDIRFTDSDGTELDYEIEDWNESGTSYVWVQVPQIDSDSDTDYVYMYYGNSSATDDQSAPDVWDSNFKGIWHMNETSGTAYDSTTNDIDLTPRNSPDQNVTGIIDGGGDFTGNGDALHNQTDSIEFNSGITLEGWFNRSGSGTGSGRILEFSRLGNADSHALAVDSNGSLRGWVECNNGSRVGSADDSTAYGTGTWYYFAYTYNGSTARLYVNGVQTDTAGGSCSDLDDTTDSIIGAISDKSGNYNLTQHEFDGDLDEHRVSDAVRSPAWIAATYKNGSDDYVSYGSEEERFESTGNIVSNIFDAEFPADWGTLTYSNSGSGTVTVKVRTDSSDDMSGATAWGSCSGISSGSDLSSDSCVTDTDQYLQYQITLEPDGANTPTFEDISIAFTASDQVAPTTNASSIAMSTSSSSGRSVVEGEWNNGTTPYFSWTAGADNDGGVGLKGYCVYLGTDSGGNPATSSGLLTNSPVSTTGSTFDISSGSYLSSALSSGTTYYINIKAIDSANNVFSGSSASFNFDHDSTKPTNVAYISTPGSNFSNVVDMSFSWPTSGGSGPSDSNSGILGYQYQINDTEGTWKGTSTDSTCGADYIPQATGSYDLTEDDDGASIAEGNNIVYFRTIDTACNTSSVATYRTGNLAYAGAAPSFETSCEATNGIAVTPTTSDTNSFALSWEDANPADGQSLESYYYMVNTTPPSSLSTITSNTATYLDNGTSTSVSAGKLTGAVKGSNTVYVVAADDADNYSASNCLKGTFTLNSELPDPPKNLAATDASIKSSTLWRASLGWDVPDYTGTGSLTYKVQRSTDNTNWTDVTTTTGTSYIDTVSDSSLYYWRVGAYDTSSESQNAPTYATAVSLTPKGTYTDPPELTSGPAVSGITTQKATITWTTSRTSDSKISFGTSSGSYGEVEASSTDQVTSHSIKLTNLEPGTTYYYKAKWTDEDGNTGESTEKSFTTDPAPVAKSVAASAIGLSTATIDFTVTGADSVRIYYGQTTSFGGVRDVSTSVVESTYSVNLTGLEDDTTYYYKINTFDEEDDEYEGTVLEFRTLPRPRIENVAIQQVKGTAQPTVLVTWDTNTEVSSIVTYYPEGSPSLARDEVNVALTEGQHRMIVRGLQANTVYSLIVKGRDKLGNEAISDTQRVTTATDTRPPIISDLKVEGTTKRVGEENQQSAQLVVSWNTDEASTSQIEYGEGTGSTYSQKTQEDISKTFNHLVVISGLTPSKVYHLRAISKDESGNIGNSIDTVTITPKATRSALDLVISNLSEVFGFLR